MTTGENSERQGSRKSMPPQLIDRLLPTQAWPIMSRTAEIDAVYSALVSRDSVGGIVIAGDMGVGKTTLARAVSRSLDARVRWIPCTKVCPDVPFAAFAGIIDTVTSDLLAMMVTIRKTIAARGYSILAIDDAHLLDPLSAALIHQLVVDRVLRVVATVRSTKVLPAAVASMWKDGYLQWLPLMPFNKQQCINQVESALGGRVDGLSAEQIWELTGGNALYVRHLVAGGLAAGTWTKVGSTWQMRSPAQVTPELVSLLEDEVGTLPVQVRRAARLLAVCKAIPSTVLAELAGESAIEEAERQGLVCVEPDEHDGLDARLRYPLVGEALRRQMGKTEHGRLRRQIAVALQRQNSMTSSTRIWVAELIVDSDQPGDGAVLVEAARDALVWGGLALGERLSRAAAARGGGLGASELLAWSLLCQGRASEAEDTLRPYDHSQLSEQDLVRWAGVRIACLRWWLGNAGAADEVVALLRLRINDDRLRLLVDAVGSILAVYDNSLQRAIALAQQVVSDPRASSASVAWAVLAGTLALGLMGRGNEAIRFARRGHAIERDVTGVHQWLITFGDVLTLTLLGDFEAATQRTAFAAQMSAALPEQLLAWGVTTVQTATVELARGRCSCAVARLEDARSLLDGDAAALWRFPVGIVLAQAYSALGKIVPARDIITELRSHFDRHVAVLGPQLRLSEAWLAAAEGRPSAAINAALEAARMAQDSGQQSIAMLSLHDAVRFGDRSCLARLADVASRTDGLLAQAVANHVEALLNRDPDAIFQAAQQFETIDALLAAADAAAQAAAAFNSIEDHANAAVASAMANRLATVCGGVQTPAMKVATHALPLTAREREVANLVAAGLTNKQIARQLIVSVRTVEGHLYRATTKLDISDREELAALIRSTEADHQICGDGA
jgi:DNA-binding NarL/FixJ family response regulator